MKGGLRLETVAGIRKGGDSGPLFVSGKPKQSLLVTALRHEETAMPPNGKLPDGLIKDVVDWVERGGTLPSDAAGNPAPRREALRISPEDRDHWAFRPLRSPPAARPSSGARGTRCVRCSTAPTRRRSSPGGPTPSAPLNRFS